MYPYYPPSQNSAELPQRKFVRLSQLANSSTNNTTSHRRPLVYIIYYSTYGHIATLASNIQDGVERSGCDCRVFQVAETLSEETLNKMNAPPRDRRIPVIKPEQLPEADGFLFGMPTRFGILPAQMKALFDACGSHWTSNSLVGKPAAVFFSTAGLGGGQETTALSCVPFFTHLGMPFVPLGYRNKSLMNLDEVHGSSPYGAGTLAGSRNDRRVSQMEMLIAHSQGLEFGKLVSKLVSRG